MQSEKTKRSKRKNKDKKESKTKKAGKVRVIVTLCILAVFVTAGVAAGFLLLDSGALIPLLKSLPSDSPLVKEGEKYLSQNNLDNAVSNFQTAISQENLSKANLIRAYENLFQISVLRNNIDDALIYLKKIEKLNPNYVRIYLYRIKLFIRMKEYTSVERELDNLSSRIKNSTEMRELIAVYKMKVGKYDEAQKLLEKISYRKRELSTHKKLIQCYIKTDNADKALKYFQKIEKKLKLSDNRDLMSEFYLLKAIAIVMAGDIENVSKDLKPNLVTGGYRDIFLRLMVYCQVLLDNREQVEDLLVKHIELEKDDSYFNKVLGDYFVFKKEYDRALEFYKRLGESGSYSLDELYTLADIYYGVGDYGSAIEVMKELSRDKGVNSPALFKNMSLSYHRKGDSSSALFYLKEGMSEFKGELDFYVRVARLLLDMESPEAALSYVEAGRELARKRGEHRYNKKFDILRVLANEELEEGYNELELLSIRDNEDAGVDNYFKLVDYYLKEERLVDMKRELETLENYPMSEEQRRNYSLYLYLLSYKSRRTASFEVSEQVLKNDVDSYNLINIAIINILESDYRGAISRLNTLEGMTGEKELLKKLYYLKAVSYYYMRNRVESNGYLNRALEIDPYFKEALYLKRL